MFVFVKESLLVTIFRASALWAYAFYKSNCSYVCVCVSVCLFTFELPLNVFLPPIPKVGCGNHTS